VTDYDPSFFAAQRGAVLGAFAGGVAVAASALESGEVVFAPRPANAPWDYVAFALTAPEGSVVSVHPEYLDFAEANRPARHYDVTLSSYLARFAVEAERRGRAATVNAEDISWALGRLPNTPQLPAGLRFEARDRTWMNAEQASGRFENGVGKPGVNGRDFRNLYAVAVVDEAGEPVAVGGLFFTYGLHEVGVDVLRDQRGAGLGRSVVAAATLEVLRRGETPFYGCATANIRSQRTAYSVGYLPCFVAAGVS
jgi:hypothetical protein